MFWEIVFGIFVLILVIIGLVHASKEKEIRRSQNYTEKTIIRVSQMNENELDDFCRKNGYHIYNNKTELEKKLEIIQKLKDDR